MTVPTELTNIVSPIPGMIVEVLIAIGDTVAVDQELFMLESMKMVTPITAESGGVVTELLVELGEPVDGGQVLARLSAQ